MRVSLFETEHFEVACTLIRLFDNGSNELTLFVYAESARQLQFLLGADSSRYTWVIREDTESKRQFIKRINAELQARPPELLWLGTVSDNFIFYARLVAALRKTRIILTLHNINNYLHSRFSWSLKSNVRTIGKRQLLSIIKEFNVISEPMANYLRSQLPNKKVYCVPGAFFNESSYQSAPPLDQHLHIAVPGGVDIRRRDYQQVFELADALKQLSINVTITLVGSITGNNAGNIADRCKEYNAQGHSIRYYETEVVDQPEFDSVLQSAHFIFTPAIIRTVLFDGIEEQYGVSTATGNQADAVRFARPWIIPFSLAIPDNLESSALRYHNIMELAGQLQKMIADPVLYHSIKEQALQNARQFTISALRLATPALF